MYTSHRVAIFCSVVFAMAVVAGCTSSPVDEVSDRASLLEVVSQKIAIADLGSKENAARIEAALELIGQARGYELGNPGSMAKLLRHDQDIRALRARHSLPGGLADCAGHAACRLHKAAAGELIRSDRFKMELVAALSGELPEEELNKIRPLSQRRSYVEMNPLKSLMHFLLGAGAFVVAVRLAFRRYAGSAAIFHRGPIRSMGSGTWSDRAGGLSFRNHIEFGDAKLYRTTTTSRIDDALQGMTSESDIAGVGRAIHLRVPLSVRSNRSIERDPWFHFFGMLVLDAVVIGLGLAIVVAMAEKYLGLGEGWMAAVALILIFSIVPARLVGNVRAWIGQRRPVDQAAPKEAEG